MTRVRSEKDRRAITVSLTETGCQVIKDVLPQHIQAIVEVMSTLTSDEQEMIGRLCRKVGKQERLTRIQQTLTSDGLKEYAG